jgi:hypothetical protein
MADDVRAQMAGIKRNVKKYYNDRRAAGIALCLFYAGTAINNFRLKQASNKYWQNQTFTAFDTVFSGVLEEKGVIGFFLAHLEEYGVYLELANDRKNAALLPTVMALYSRFQRDLEALYAA